MKISELIAKIGDEHVKVQTLAENMTCGSITRNGGKITFATSAEFVSEMNRAAILGGKPSHVGLVVWLPRERLPEEMR